jgi:hypothetical protein
LADKKRPVLQTLAEKFPWAGKRGIFWHKREKNQRNRELPIAAIGKPLFPSTSKIIKNPVIQRMRLRANLLMNHTITSRRNRGGVGLVDP